MSKIVNFKGVSLAIKGDDGIHQHEDNYVDSERPKTSPSLILKPLPSESGSFSTNNKTVRRLSDNVQSRTSYDHGENESFNPVIYNAYHAYAEAEAEAAKGHVVSPPPRFDSLLPYVGRPKELKKEIPEPVLTTEMIESDKELRTTGRKYI